MDYQPTGNTPEPAMNQTPEPMMSQPPVQKSAQGVWYVIVAVIIVVLGLWYFYGTRTSDSSDVPTSAIEQSQLPVLTGGDTTADITADLNQIPDTSAALGADAAAIAGEISNL
ncbi:MAG: hypothetical protein NUV60_03775 [Patescibacteria group bacterium]|nr:hypothetical protein [Patescibacteria group bacterium]